MKFANKTLETRITSNYQRCLLGLGNGLGLGLGPSKRKSKRVFTALMFFINQDVTF